MPIHKGTVRVNSSTDTICVNILLGGAWVSTAAAVEGELSWKVPDAYTQNMQRDGRLVSTQFT